MLGGMPTIVVFGYGVGKNQLYGHVAHRDILSLDIYQS